MSIAVTVLGALWIGLGLGYILLIRELPVHGELATFTLLLAVFAGDTAAYLGGRVFGRHRMAPTVSPGKTWEGFVLGSAVCVFVTWVALYKTGFVDGWRSFVLGGALAVSLGARRPVRVVAQARRRRQGQRPAPGRATAGCSTASTRCSSPARSPTT